MLFVFSMSGNTNTVLGVFWPFESEHPNGDDSAPPLPSTSSANWRVATRQGSTVDESRRLVPQICFRWPAWMLRCHSFGICDFIRVPPLDPVLRQVCERYFNSKPLLIEPGVKTGMPVHYDNPRPKWGRTASVNWRGCIRKIRRPMRHRRLRHRDDVRLRFPRGRYLGRGVICPGIGISADALLHNGTRACRAWRFLKPARVIARTQWGSSVRALLRLSRPGRMALLELL